MTDPNDTVRSTDSGPSNLMFPPFPIAPIAGEGGSSSIISFKHFKEHGIRIFSDTGVETDGLGVPTIELGVVHELDECKTETRRKLKDGKDGKDVLEGKAEPVKPGNNPMERAKDQRKQRFLLFAKKEWFDQWSEGEHLRGLKTYDPYAH
jgi:hypothetical protein